MNPGFWFIVLGVFIAAGLIFFRWWSKNRPSTSTTFSEVVDKLSVWKAKGIAQASLWAAIEQAGLMDDEKTAMELATYFPAIAAWKIPDAPAPQTTGTVTLDPAVLAAIKAAVKEG